MQALRQKGSARTERKRSLWWRDLGGIIRGDAPSTSFVVAPERVPNGFVHCVCWAGVGGDGTWETRGKASSNDESFYTMGEETSEQQSWSSWTKYLHSSTVDGQTGSSRQCSMGAVPVQGGWREGPGGVHHDMELMACVRALTYYYLPYQEHLHTQYRRTRAPGPWTPSSVNPSHGSPPVLPAMNAPLHRCTALHRCTSLHMASLRRRIRHGKAWPPAELLSDPTAMRHSSSSSSMSTYNRHIVVALAASGCISASKRPVSRLTLTG